ncbi:MAG TPA: hypothetical protein VMA72_12735 [Streptosporangiaceae bacterium]|nr:hypothetical protein [Streptosporangiaceae bacterium]
MLGSRRLPRRLAATLSLAVVSCGLALASTAGTAQAATPDAWGYALVLNPSGPVAASHWKESVASPTPTATPGVVGQVAVKFPKIGFFKQGIVHVTAVIDELAWCQAQRWYPTGGKEVVVVRCYTKGGVPTFVPFTVLFTTSSGKLANALQYAYVHDSGSAVVSSYNSTGLTNTVANLSTGVWRVKVPGPSPATHAGGIQVTAVNRTTPAICDVGGQTWTTSGQTIVVRCYGSSGKPMKTGWNLSYQRARAITGAKPKLFAYALNTKPLVAGPYAPAPPGIRFNSGGGVNNIERSGGGEWLVRLPHVGILPNSVFVTAAYSTPRVCNLNTTWATAAGPGTVTVRDVVCYNPSGTMTPSKWFLSYTS